MSDLEKLQQRRERLRNGIGLGILVAAFGWSVVEVGIQTFGPHGETSLTADKKVIRLVHWQLEAGFVKAMDEAMREYERLHPDVIVEQIDVHERAYHQWVQTQLVGRTAPDLVELRFADNLIVRYFVPLTEIVDRPNPYNVGTDLAGVPWRETYIDGMLGGYKPELKDYYAIPMSVFTIRCYANANLLREAAGVTEPPKSLGEFFSICERIQTYAREKKLKLVPIAGSSYQETFFRGRYKDMAMWPLVDIMDLDSDGAITYGERLAAMYGDDPGRPPRAPLREDPYWAAFHKVTFDICRYFSPGFMAAQRDQAVFLFAQGNAAMIATGTWDAGSLWQQVEGEFPIMVFDFPVPAPGERYYDIMPYRPTEAGTLTAGLFGLSKFSRHPDVALDFMQFLTSRRVNEELNMKWRWFPAIRGARTDEILERFRPDLEGVYGPVYDLGMGPDTQLRFDQLYKKFIAAVPPENEPYEEFLDRHYRAHMRSLAQAFDDFAFTDFVKYWENSYSAGVQSEAALAQVRARAMREGLTDDIRRNLLAVTLGQVRRMMGRCVEYSQYERAKAAYETRQEAALAGPGGGP